MKYRDMEFGGFADDLFEEATQRTQIIPNVTYTPKVLTPQWYLDDGSAPADDQEKVQFHVFQGDHHYYRGEWVLAAQAYARGLGCVAPSNPCMRRLLLESVGRCRLRSGDFPGAVEMGERLLTESTSENQLFTAHSVLATLYAAAGKIEEQKNSLHFCLRIRPLSSQLWIQLAKALLQQLPHSGHLDVRDTEQATKYGLAKSRTESDEHERTAGETSADIGSVCSCSVIRTSDQNDGIQSLQHARRSEHCRQPCKLTEDNFTRAARAQGVQIQENRGGGRGQSVQCNNDECIRCECNTGKTRFSAGIDNKVSSLRERESLSVISNGIANDFQTLSVTEGTRTAYENGPPLEMDSVRDRSELKSAGNGHLVREIAQCLIKAKLILQMDRLSAVSLARKRNEQLMNEVEELLQSLHLHPTSLAEITDQVSRDISG